MLPTSGQISLSQVQTEFGGSNPIQLSEYKSTLHGGPLNDIGTYLWGAYDGYYRLGGLHGRKTGGYEAMGAGSGTWTIPAGTIYIYAYLIGGGGGGAMFFFFSSGYGGGSGGHYWPAQMPATGSWAPGQTINYTIGTGGAGGYGGGPNDGSNGNASTFGSITAGGGEGGVYGQRGGYGGSPNGVQGACPTGGNVGVGYGIGGDGAPVYGNGSNGSNGALFIRWFS